MGSRSPASIHPRFADETTVDDLIFFSPPTPVSPATFTPIGVDGCSPGGTECTSGFAYSVVGGSEYQAYTWTGGIYPGTSGPNYPAGQYEYAEGSYPSPFLGNRVSPSTLGVPEPGAVVLSKWHAVGFGRHFEEKTGMSAFGNLG